MRQTGKIAATSYKNTICLVIRTNDEMKTKPLAFLSYLQLIVASPDIDFRLLKDKLPLVNPFVIIQYPFYASKQFAQTYRHPVAIKLHLMINLIVRFKSRDNEASLAILPIEIYEKILSYLMIHTSILFNHPLRSRSFDEAIKAEF